VKGGRWGGGWAGGGGLTGMTTLLRPLARMMSCRLRAAHLRSDDSNTLLPTYCPALFSPNHHPQTHMTWHDFSVVIKH
jgi:hypothetical protein